MNIEPFFPRAEEKPLDTLVGDGGLCGVFRTIGCATACPQANSNRSTRTATRPITICSNIPGDNRPAWRG